MKPLLRKSVLTTAAFLSGINLILMVVVLFLGSSLASLGQVFEKVYSITDARAAEFGVLGSEPVGALVARTDGNFFGVTRKGGSADLGTIYRITPDGSHTLMAEFSGITGGFKGSQPQGGLTRGPDGNFYGTTSKGGANDLGTVFRITPAGVMTTIVEFTGATGASMGAEPNAPLVLASDGNFYGTTRVGGANGVGTVFQVRSTGALTTIRDFASGTPACCPKSGLTIGPDGRLYGVTPGFGTVYRLNTNGGGFTVLVQFTDINGAFPGIDPLGPLTLGSDGNFYGVTDRGGADDRGTVYRVTPNGNYTNLIQFPLGAGTIGPRSPLYQGRDGDLYAVGTSGSGGDKIVRMTNAGVATVVANIGITSGSESPLIEGLDGGFYGTTAGASQNRGTIFKASDAGVVKTLAAFSGTGVSDLPREPFSGLTLGSDGSFYGTVTTGGGTAGSGFSGGGVFKLSTAGKYEFLADRIGPFSSVVEDADGNFLGTLLANNSFDSKIYKMSPTGTILGEQSPPPNTVPFSPLIRASDGKFYGTARSVFGGSSGGAIYRVTSNLDLETLYTFDLAETATKGWHPNAALLEDANGNFYGTTTRGGSSGNGTVFRMSPTGVLDTLVHFSGNGATNKGKAPYGALIRASDGFLYGTTLNGGASDLGTVFRMTDTGTLTTLVEFTGEVGLAPGSEAWAGLIQHAGNLYGTTARGGTDNLGTIYKISPSGVYSTVFEFASLPVDYNPFGALIQDGEGNLYGTTRKPDGGVYRLIFPGRPLLLAMDPLSIGTNSAVVQSMVNARGSSTTISLEYGTDGISFPTVIPVRSGITGFQSNPVGATIGNLTPGLAYFFRFRATSSAGTKVGNVQSFVTLSAPLVQSLPATNISTTSAILNGTVNARNSETTVIIEWGTDGNSFPNKLAATPSTVTGDTPVPVSFVLGDKQPGQTFFYRVVATNVGGTATSGTERYRTLSPSTASVTGARALSTTRAQVVGFVDAKGSSADVFFEYGTDGLNFPNSFTANPASVSGDSLTEVTATLTGLTQGTTYFFRIRAIGPGGTGLSAASTLSLSILSGLEQVFPDPPPAANGTVTVNFTPPSTGAWRFKGDTEWKNSGVASGNLANGQRVIEFIPIPGFIRPPSETVDVTSTGSITLDRIYFDTPVAGSGALTVSLKPDSLVGQGVPVASRIQWRVVGETAWRNSGDQVSSLAAGSYLVECKPVAGRETPPTISVSIGTNDSQDLTLTYFTANTSGGLPPLPQTFANVSTNEDLPYAYVGQIRSEVGSSTGFVVKRRVVATAGHVVFDDGTLSAVTDLQWFFQKHTGQHEPKPQIPRGYYLAAGYAAQRNADNSPGEGSAQSQDLDYAALYFIEEAGRGGYGGYLASDSGDDNEFLNSTAEKILAGYPVEGVPPSGIGKLHATASFSSAMVPAFRETWTTNAVRGFGGISGGPLFVRFENGSYLPAAIYLGGAGQTVVRAIDSDVVELFLRAEVSGNGGDNNTGGGITHTSVAGNLNLTQTGSLRVIIEPANAASMGGAWKLNPETTLRQGGAQKSGLSPGGYSLGFTAVAGFTAPATQTVSVSGGQLTTVTFTYQSTSGSTPLETWRQLHFRTTDNIGDAADTEDPDKDGMRNIDEFTAGTDPKSGSDLLQIKTPIKTGGTFTATVAGKAGRSYKLQRNPTLTGEWTTVNTRATLPSDQTITLNDFAAPADNAFYRIEVSAP